MPGVEAAKDAASAPVPQHVAIIMDGNGRWAEEQGLPRLEGHRRGASVVRNITTYARELGIQALTLYSFSRQNWRRPALEVAGLMRLLADYCRSEHQTLMQNDIRLTTIGELSRLPLATREALRFLLRQTQNNRSMTLCLAVDYGGREEIVSACRRALVDAQAGRLAPEALDEAALSARLDTAALPELDLLIRTSGEQRVSNFMLWQLAYAEMHFAQVRWPDFSRAHFAAALSDFAQRQRRFGHSEPTGRQGIAPASRRGRSPASAPLGKDQDRC